MLLKIILFKVIKIYGLRLFLSSTDLYVEVFSKIMNVIRILARLRIIHVTYIHI